MTIVGWRIFYDDGSEYSSKSFEPDKVPLDGVQWIKEFFADNTSRYTHGMDFYRWTGDSWAGGNANDLERWLRIREVHIILFGRWTSDKKYQEIREKVNNCNDC